MENLSRLQAAMDRAIAANDFEAQHRLAREIAECQNDTVITEDDLPYRGSEYCFSDEECCCSSCGKFLRVGSPNWSVGLHIDGCE